MYAEEEHVALPSLSGAPAYARPPLHVRPTALPLDPDDLPIAACQTPQEQRVAETLPARPYQTVIPERPSREEPRPEPRPMVLRALADRIMHRAS